MGTERRIDYNSKPELFRKIRQAINIFSDDWKF